MQLRRDNNVDNKTKLTVKGVWWPGNFGAADNALSSAYQYKVTSAEQYTDGGTVSITITGEEWSFDGYLPGDLGIEGFDFQKSFSVVLNVTDAFTTAAANGIVDRGIPTMHMDKGGVGIGKIRENGALDVEGVINGTRLQSTENGQTMYTRGESQAYFDFYTTADNFWFNKPLQVYGGHLVYHEGYKPTPATIGAANLLGSVTSQRYVQNGTDFNTLKTPGWYQNESNAAVTNNTNMPEKIAFCMLVTENKGIVQQLFFGYNSSKICLRSFYNWDNSWTGWAQFYTSLKKPTPAEIGALSTARDVTIAWGNGGYYIRFSQNFQICTKVISGTININTPWGNSWESGAIDCGLWPAAFAGAPYAFAAVADSPGGIAYAVEPLVGTTKTAIGKTYLYRSSNSSVNSPYKIFVFGICEKG